MAQTGDPTLGERSTREVQRLMEECPRSKDIMEQTAGRSPTWRREEEDFGQVSVWEVWRDGCSGNPKCLALFFHFQGFYRPREYGYGYGYNNYYGGGFGAGG